MPRSAPSFRPAHMGQKLSTSDQEYDRRRGSARQRLYTPTWDRASRRFLRGSPLCLGCKAVGIIEPASLTDHVEPHDGDIDKFWNEEMWQPACTWHHSVIKQVLERRFRAGRLMVADLWLDSETAKRETLAALDARAAD